MSYRPYWAKRFGTAPFLPTTRAELDAALRRPVSGVDVVVATIDREQRRALTERINGSR